VAVELGAQQTTHCHIGGMNCHLFQTEGICLWISSHWICIS